MSLRQGRNAAHCPGLTARARPEARPEIRAADPNWITHYLFIATIHNKDNYENLADYRLRYLWMPFQSADYYRGALLLLFCRLIGFTPATRNMPFESVTAKQLN